MHIFKNEDCLSIVIGHATGHIILSLRLLSAKADGVAGKLIEIKFHPLIAKLFMLYWNLQKKILLSAAA